MKTLKKECKDNGLVLERISKRSYRIMARINDEVISWSCITPKECKEAIFQAVCLRKWATEIQ